MSTLVEKYRPKDWQDVEGNDWIKSVLQRMIDNDSTQHMIFVGQPGCGKTTLARIFASKYLGEDVDFSIDHPDYREMNASDERGIDVIRGRKVKDFCQTNSQTPGKKRILYLDEADGFTQDSQRALRAIMENNQARVIIIMAINHLEKITEKALLSRCVVFKFDPAPPEKLGSYLLFVMHQEGIKLINDSIIDDIITFPEYQGDFRRMLNDTVQKLVGIDHAVTKNDVPWIYENNYTHLIEEMLLDKQKITTLFFQEYSKRYIDPVIFIKQLFEATEKRLTFEQAKIFAEVEFRIKQGGDELIQLTYLLRGLI